MILYSVGVKEGRKVEVRRRRGSEGKEMSGGKRKVREKGREKGRKRRKGELGGGKRKKG